MINLADIRYVFYSVFFVFKSYSNSIRRFQETTTTISTYPNDKIQSQFISCSVPILVIEFVGTNAALVAAFGSCLNGYLTDTALNITNNYLFDSPKGVPISTR